MKKILIILVSFMFIFSISSCGKEINPEYEIVTRLNEFRSEIDYSFMFVIDEESKMVSGDSIDNYYNIKSIIKYDKKKDILLYYRYLLESDQFEKGNHVTRNFIGYIFYDESLEKYVVTNSNTMTYRISNYGSIKEIFEDILGYKFDAYIFNNMQNIFDDSGKKFSDFSEDYSYQKYNKGFKMESNKKYNLDGFWFYKRFTYEFYEYVDNISLPNFEDYIEHPFKK